MDSFILLGQGIRYVFSSLRRKMVGTKRFSGSAKAICQQIVKACWNGRYFENSLGNYREFWTRDFGFSVDALLALGYRKEVLQTLAYALEKFAKHGRIETTITPRGRPVSFPALPSPDSVALLLHSLKQAKATALVKNYKPFLEAELKRMSTLVERGLVREDVQLSGMRDYAIRHSSCYDNVMMLFMANLAHALHVRNAPAMDRKRFLKTFWNGEYFRDDLQRNHFTADANLLPFWTGVVDKKLFARVHPRLAILACPFPMKYTASESHKRMRLPELFVPNWEHDCIWSNLGMLTIATIAKFNRSFARDVAKVLGKVVERDRTLYEVFTPDGKQPYRSWAYFADEGMLWAAVLAANL
ncbi:MAG TPA: hypothetical protein VLJ21_03370 [Candidatus Binatia bacterium]|nr:hypothetical protein [Candidatus Binatia bacterium]